jgi:hypothetical protein
MGSMGYQTRLRLATAMNENRRFSARRVFGFHIVLAIALALVLARVVAAYWAYFHMGTAGGNGAFLTIVVVPGATALLCGIAYVCYSVARRLRWGPVWQGLVGAGCLVLSVVLLFSAEVWRTADYQTESGEPVDVSEFLAHWF